MNGSPQEASGGMVSPEGATKFRPQNWGAGAVLNKQECFGGESMPLPHALCPSHSLPP